MTAERIKNSKILIVDDADVNRAIVREIFRKEGFTRLEVAENGLEALNKTRDWRPDLVLLDLIMPEMDGFEYCRAVRSDSAFLDLPILVQSGVSEIGKVAEAFQAGANDYVSKPVNPPEMLARAKIHLERRFLLGDLHSYRNRMEKELAEAWAMQLEILPTLPDTAVAGREYGLDIASYFQVSSELGGDFWGITPISRDELAVYMMDCTGHGVAAALNTVRIHTLLKDRGYFSLPPHEFMVRLNNRLIELLPQGHFATAFYGVANIKRNTLSYASAAAPSPVLMHRGHAKMLETAGYLLGSMPGADYALHEVSYRPGDSLLLYSDALTETKDARGSLLPEEDIAEFLRDTEGSSSEDRMHMMVNMFQERFGGNLRDDLNLILCARKR